MDVDELGDHDPRPRHAGCCAASRWPMPQPPLAAAEAFEVLMGKDVESRRAYIVANSALLDREALDI